VGSLTSHNPIGLHAPFFLLLLFTPWAPTGQGSCQIILRMLASLCLSFSEARNLFQSNCLQWGMWTDEGRLRDPRSPVSRVSQQNNRCPEHASVLTSAVHVKHTVSVSAISRLISLPRRRADSLSCSAVLWSPTEQLRVGGGGSTVCHDAKLPLYN
jgi:hypothetical protein